MSTVIRSLEAKELRKRSWVIRLADRLASFFGSFEFLVITFVFFAIWVTINLGLVPNVPVFDPYPFVLLITIVSIEAIILSVIVLMSQNRQSYISTLREEIDFQINKIAEKEISLALRLLVRIAEKQGVKVTDEELKEIVSDVEVSYIEKRLQAQLENKNESLVKSITNPFTKVKK